MSMEIWHVLPLGDLRDHEPDVNCWCHPQLLDDDDAGNVYMHTSMDGREAFETGDRKMS